MVVFPGDSEAAFQFPPALQYAFGIPADRDTAEVKLNTWSWVNWEPVECASWMAASTEGICLGEVEISPACWPLAQAPRRVPEVNNVKEGPELMAEDVGERRRRGRVEDGRGKVYGVCIQVKELVISIVQRKIANPIGRYRGLVDGPRKPKLVAGTQE